MRSPAHVLPRERGPMTTLLHVPFMRCSPSGVVLRAGRTAAGVMVAVLLAAGCSGGGDATADAETDALSLRLVIPDGNIREPDVPCSGASGYRYAHPGEAYTIRDAEGREVASGTLPEGRAEKAFTLELGDRRQPTVCVMMVEVRGVESLDGHVLVIGDRSPVPIMLNRNLGNVPEAVLP